MNWEKLKQKIVGEITTNHEQLEHYSRDASIFEVTPQAVVSPKNIEDICELVKFVSANKANLPELSLTVRAAGSDMTGGPINDSIIIDVTRHLNRLCKIDGTQAITEPGLLFRDLERSLMARGLMMPAYPASKGWCAVGGMVGNNAGGEKTFRQGQVKDYVTELEVVLADGKPYTFKPLCQEQLNKKLEQPGLEGEIYRKMHGLIKDNYRLLHTAKPTTSKNSSGYLLWDVYDGKTFDLTKVLVGSQGTLGIITKITWRTVPIKRHSRLLVIELNDIKLLGKLSLHLGELEPDSLEMFDSQTLRLALKHSKEIYTKVKSSYFKFLLMLIPDWLKLVFGQLPKITLLAEFSGETQKEAEEKSLSTGKAIQRHFNITAKMARDRSEMDKYQAIRRESFNLLRLHNARRVSAPFIEDIIVHPSQLPEFLPELDKILSHYPDFEYTIAGHAGDANFHIIPIVDMSVKKHREQVVEISDKVFGLVKRYQGSMSAEHNDGIVRGPFLEKMYGQKVVELFRETKTIFDPQNIFNPHKKTDATMAFYKDHLRNA